MAKKPIKIARKKAGLPKSLAKVEATYKELQATEREISRLSKLRRKLSSAEQKSLRQLKQKRIRLGYELQKRPPSRAKGTHTAIRQAAANIARAPVAGRAPKESPKIAAAGTARTVSRPTAVEQAERRTETIRKEAVRQPPVAQRKGEVRTRKVKWTEPEKVRTRKAPMSYSVHKGEPLYDAPRPVKGGAGNGRKTNKPPPSRMDKATAKKISETRLHAEARTHIAEGGTWDGRKSTMPKGPKSKWAKADLRLYERFMKQQRKAVAKGEWFEMHGRTAKYYTSGKQKGGMIFDNFLPEDKPLKPTPVKITKVDTGSQYSMRKPPKKVTGAERARRAKASMEAKKAAALVKPKPHTPEKVAEKVAARAQADKVRASLKKPKLREPKPTKAELRKYVDTTEASIIEAEKAKPSKLSSRPQTGDPPKTYGAGTGPKPKKLASRGTYASGEYKLKGKQVKFSGLPSWRDAVPDESTEKGRYLKGRMKNLKFFEKRLAQMEQDRAGPKWARLSAQDKKEKIAQAKRRVAHAKQAITDVHKPRGARVHGGAPFPSGWLGRDLKKILRGKSGGGAWFIPIILMQEWLETGEAPAMLKAGLQQPGLKPVKKRLKKRRPSQLEHIRRRQKARGK